MKNNRKIFVLLMVLVLSISLVACGKNESGTTGSVKLSTEEIIDKQMAATDTIKSGKMKMDLTMEMNGEGEGESFTMQTVTDAEFMMEPLVMRLDTSMNLSGEIVENSMYLTKDEMHIQIPETDEWQTVPAEMAGIDIEEFMDEFSTEKVSEILKNHIKDVSIEEKADSYIIKYNGSGDMLKELVENMMSSSMGVEDLGNLDELDITEFHYTNEIDKSTFLPIHSEANYTMTVMSEGETITINQIQIMDFSELNSITEVAIPEM